MAGEAGQQLRAYVEYLRDIGVHDFYRRGEPVYSETSPTPPPVAPVEAAVVVKELEAAPVPGRPAFLEPPIATLVSFDNLALLPESRVAPAHKAAALAAIQEDIGDCTRCPLAYAGRRTIVFGDGDANARLMFVGEGPGADEDTSGVPFVGKAGQLLNNMIQAMGLKREQVYIANIVKCRPPANRVPEPVEANTCDQFLLQQIDVVQPQVVVALGSTAAMYLLGVKQSLSALRGRWHRCRGAKLAVTYHPAFLLRDPRMKSEAWKDLQMVMAEMGLKAPAKS
jgi:uracil-DNA glycosylase